VFPLLPERCSKGKTIHRVSLSRSASEVKSSSVGLRSQSASVGLRSQSSSVSPRSETSAQCSSVSEIWEADSAKVFIVTVTGVAAVCSYNLHSE
jgi:hypothetical protein